MILVVPLPAVAPEVSPERVLANCSKDYYLRRSHSTRGPERKLWAALPSCMYQMTEIRSKL
jgi:hypothetical protein